MSSPIERAIEPQPVPARQEQQRQPPPADTAAVEPQTGTQTTAMPDVLAMPVQARQPPRPQPPATPPPQQQGVVLHQQPAPAQQQPALLQPRPMRQSQHAVPMLPLPRSLQVIPVGPAPGAAPAPITMARAVPVAIAAQQVWGDPSDAAIPFVEGNLVGNQVDIIQHETTINARWATPSESWSTLGNRLRVFFEARRPAYANRQYVVSLVVSHFGVNFATQPRPTLDAEERLKQALIQRYILATPCESYCMPPGTGGNYNQGSAGLLEWWCKVLAWLFVAFAVAGTFLLVSSSQAEAPGASVAAASCGNCTVAPQEKENTQALGMFLCVVAGILALPAIWVLCIKTLQFSLHCCCFVCCCIDLGGECGPTDFCDCLNWCCRRERQRVYPDDIENRGDDDLGLQQAQGKAASDRHRESRSLFNQASYSNQDSCLECQIYCWYVFAVCGESWVNNIVQCCLAFGDACGRLCTGVPVLIGDVCGRCCAYLWSCHDCFKLCGGACECATECCMACGECCSGCDVDAFVVCCAC